MEAPITECVDRQNAAYNARHARDCAACFAEDATIERELDGTKIQGRPAIEAFYVKLFATYPQNQFRVLHRLAVAEHVIDEEIITGRPEGDFRTIVIYRIQNGQITHLRSLGREPFTQPT